MIAFCSSVRSVKGWVSTAMQPGYCGAAEMNFARDIVGAAPPGRLALVELARDGGAARVDVRRGRDRTRERSPPACTHRACGAATSS